jgi:hypothetical protein
VAVQLKQADKKQYEELAEEAIEFAMKMIGTPYGHDWREDTWPELSPLYSNITRHDGPAWYRQRPCICSGLINILRFEVADLPAVGSDQRDPRPGGTRAIGTNLAHTDGTRRYEHAESTPRGWLCFAEYRDTDLALQGHVRIALGNPRLLESRVPRLTDGRIEEDVSDLMPPSRTVGQDKDGAEIRLTASLCPRHPSSPIPRRSGNRVSRKSGSTVLGR